MSWETVHILCAGVGYVWIRSVCGFFGAGAVQGETNHIQAKKYRHARKSGGILKIKFLLINLKKSC